MSLADVLTLGDFEYEIARMAAPYCVVCQGEGRRYDIDPETGTVRATICEFCEGCGREIGAKL